jgi:hypothetical protein
VTERLPLEILPQPNDTTCGPTCLHALYRYYGEAVALDQVVREVPCFDEGGTLAVFLACHALRRGYRARLYTYNLQMFDPTWFAEPEIDLRARLLAQLEHKHDERLGLATRGYVEYIELGGEVRFEDLTSSLIRKYLTRGRPILTGLSATYLHHSIREYGLSCTDDDIRGTPQGHFVVLCGYDRQQRQVLVADPLYPNPLAVTHIYAARIDRVLGAILLGILTHDANLLILEPPPPAGDGKGPLRVPSDRC